MSTPTDREIVDTPPPSKVTRRLQDHQGANRCELVGLCCC